MPDRLLGALLFLPVPVVLVLFTRAPFGVGASIGLGVLVMATHRLYARPFALSRADRRCLWCGGAAGDGPRTAETIRVPFPVHIQALIGTAVMLWLFRIVGFVWIVQVILFVVHRP